MVIFNIGKYLKLPYEYRNKGIRVINSSLNPETLEYYKSVQEIREIASRFLFTKNIIEKVECANLL